MLAHRYDSIGVSQISAATAAMILKNPATPGTTYTDPVILPSDEDERDDVRETILNSYKTRTDSRAKVDLYNLLRFPKSNIAVCFQLLNYLKNRAGRFEVLTTDQCLNDDNALALIATEFEIGATSSKTADAKPNDFGKAIKKVIGSPLFALGLGGSLELTISGRVFDETDEALPMTGARVDLYVMLVRMDVAGRKCLRRFEGMSGAVPEAKTADLAVRETPVTQRCYDAQGRLSVAAKRQEGRMFDHSASCLMRRRSLHPLMDAAGSCV